MTEKGVLLEELTWVEAEKLLTPDTLVVIPLGAAAKEHGPHLPLNNDYLLAEYLKRRVMERADVVVAPTVSYYYYPAFTEYPGSTTLSQGTARDLTIQIINSLAAFGPKKFYVLNTGLSTIRSLLPAAEILRDRGVIMTYTDWDLAIGELEKRIMKQPGGSHADEIETSMMLYITPEHVDMSKAVADYNPDGNGRLTRKIGGAGTFSPSGVFGDPTLANAETGKIMVEALVDAILNDIESLRNTCVIRS
jgi:creatinine amidohydrolase